MRLEGVAPELEIGGVACETLARTYGTPLLVLDTGVLDAKIAFFADLAAGFDLDVCYAGKALLFVALARRIARSPLGLDVCSLGELLTAERAGVPAERLVLHGCGKTDEELRAVCAGRAGRIVVDNVEELERLTRVAAPERPVPVLLRVNPGIEAHTHAYVRTGGEESKFGFPLGDLAAAVEATLGAPGLRLAGLHTHLGSQIFDPAPYLAALEVLLDEYDAIARRGAALGQLVIGGGFGVDSREGERFDLRATLALLDARLAERYAGRVARRPRLGIEPGRGIVAEAGTSLYRVVAVKRQGGRRFAIVDGGIADNPRPALYGAYHHPSLRNRHSAAALEPTTVCGRSCENDRLVEAGLPADLCAGDLLALETTGAYTYSMASNYNRFGRPAVVFSGDGTHRLAVRREEAADVLRNDVGAEEENGAPSVGGLPVYP